MPFFFFFSSLLSLRMCKWYVYCWMLSFKPQSPDIFCMFLYRVKLVLIYQPNDMFRPELFSVLAQKLQSTDVLSSHRIFLTLFRTLKELSTKRLISDQKNFAEVYSTVLFPLFFYNTGCLPFSRIIVLWNQQCVEVWSGIGVKTLLGWLRRLGFLNVSSVWH